MYIGNSILLHLFCLFTLIHVVKWAVKLYIATNPRQVDENCLMLCFMLCVHMKDFIVSGMIKQSHPANFLLPCSISFSTRLREVCSSAKSHCSPDKSPAGIALASTILQTAPVQQNTGTAFQFSIRPSVAYLLKYWTVNTRFLDLATTLDIGQ